MSRIISKFFFRLQYVLFVMQQMEFHKEYENLYKEYENLYKEQHLSNPIQVQTITSFLFSQSTIKKGVGLVIGVKDTEWLRWHRLAVPMPM